MFHAVPLGFQIAGVIGIGGNGDGNPAGNFNAVSLQTHQLLGIVGEQADAAHAKIQQNLPSKVSFRLNFLCL